MPSDQPPTAPIFVTSGSDRPAALQCALPASSSSATMLGMTDEQKLAQMTDDLRRVRERCESKSNQNPRYLRYSNAVSALRWIIDDLAKERAMHPDR
jgi:hypothetical protein